MTNDERLLITILKSIVDRNVQAIILQAYIADKGLLSEQAASEVRKILLINAR